MAIDWTKSMKQEFEFYKVNPATWKDDEQLHHITNFKIVRDLSESTCGHANISTTKDYGESYIRAYMKCTQGEEQEMVPLATVLAQTPGKQYDGFKATYDIDAYTPLIELKNDKPPIGYAIKKGLNVMIQACRLTAENINAPLIEAKREGQNFRNNFCANLDDTWLSFISDMIQYVQMRFEIDGMGRVTFAPFQELSSLSPCWTYTDDENSIFYPEIKDDQDFYSIPNVVEILYSSYKGMMYVRVENNDPNSKVSTVNRGRTILYRDTNPSVSETATIKEVKEYAVTLLKELSSLEHTVTYSHGFTPVQIGSCVRLNYERAGLVDVKAKVISQSFDCSPGCKVEETAVYTTNLWEGEKYDIVSRTY